MTKRRRRLVLLAAAAIVAMTGCGGQEPQVPAEPTFDRSAWQTDVRSVLTTDPDWGLLEKAGRDICTGDIDVMRHTLLIALNEGAADNVMLIKISVDHFCPERSAEVDTLLSEIVPGY